MSLSTSYRLSKEIYIFRHGETDYNKKNIRQGCENDIELNNNGKQQAEKVGDYLKKYQSNKDFDLIISSGMIRATQTANIIAEKISYVKPLLIIDNLKEKCHGDISGKIAIELESDSYFTKYIELNTKFNNEQDPISKHHIHNSNEKIFNKLYKSESTKLYRHRVKKALLELYNRPEEKIIIISHANTIELLLQIITDINDHIISKGNCSMTYLKVYEKTKNNKIKRKIKIIKLLTNEHLLL